MKLVYIFYNSSRSYRCKVRRYATNSKGETAINLPSLMAGLADERLPNNFYNMAYTNLFGIG